MIDCTVLFRHFWQSIKREQQQCIQNNQEHIKARISDVAARRIDEYEEHLSETYRWITLIAVGTKQRIVIIDTYANHSQYRLMHSQRYTSRRWIEPLLQPHVEW